MSKLRLSAKVMSKHEITFNPNLPEEVRTRADFTYKIMPNMFSIVDTGLGSCGPARGHHGRAVFVTAHEPRFADPARRVIQPCTGCPNPNAGRLL
jgi:hypothetical protein